MLFTVMKSSLLSNLDIAWHNTVVQSQAISKFRQFTSALCDKFQQWSFSKSTANYLKQFGVYLTILLFVCLPLPQFANDKQGLATILLAAAICWFGGGLLFKQDKKKGNFVDAIVLLFFCINIVSTCSSHYLAASFHGLLKLFVFVVAYFLFSAQLKDNPKLQFVFLFILLAGGALLSLDGLYQYKIGVAPLATWEDPSIENQATRIYATFNNPNLLAGYLLPLIMLCASLVFACWNHGKWMLSIGPSALTALITVALLLTGSRGAYIGVFAGFASIVTIGLAKLWQQKKKRRFTIPVLLALIALASIAAFHYLPTFEQRITSIFAGREHSSNSFRLNVWLSSLAMFKDNWLIGIGVGNQAFRLAYGLYMRSGFDALGTYCVPLEIAVETGIFGLLIFVLLIIGMLYRAHQVFWSQSKTSELLSNNTSSNIQSYISTYKQWLTAGAAIALIAMMAHGLVDTVFFRPQIEFIFFLLVAIIVANSETNTEL